MKIFSSLELKDSDRYKFFLAFILNYNYEKQEMETPDIFKKLVKYYGKYQNNFRNLFIVAEYSQILPRFFNFILSHFCK
ncbi:MAG: hypothetical protein AAGJ08_29335 [Cyanobacteria bacterium P01_H01_bin.35]